MESIIVGSLALSLVHAAIPNHWLPVALIGKSEHWSLRETLSVSAISGFFHTFSTVLLGILIGAIGVRLTEQLEDQTRWIASLILVFMGLAYWATQSNHTHHEHVPSGMEGRSKRAIIFTLAISMLFSPCLEIETFFFTAGTYGWWSIALLASIYTLFTIACMVLLTALSYRGLAKLHWHWLEQHEKRITGSLLIFLGILNFFIDI